ncbi:unnamed protein product (macronuclear) [Paramecium tetraurelia]|uniref:EGF-like domain-containing protein n=1 Tax=Paramecium tetraurelia TaxID=5888 RepID=A0CR21_PARTE|nr:uncharacterized protein GSPATT00009551001 [Paramecium tetraurelia]CAK73238.1 unnamed protein product [Paramecium tetraurelia]|eukprot:XP_001440635.1 hypothetical protein (macronuclear) [Paramecium tetraurelia strain d4-2]
MNAKEIQLQQFGCSEMFNKYACLIVENYSCTWENQRCTETKGIDYSDSQLCNIFLTPVNPHTCSQIPSAKCMSGGDFECIELRSEQLSQLSCNEIGLNEEGCYALNKIDQYCTFRNGKCQELKLSDIQSCDQKLSKSACLSNKNNDLQCEWFGKQCRTFKYETGQVCVTKNQVNTSVCQKSTGLCQYDESQSKCVIIQNYHINNLQCNTPGLSKIACLSVINQNCTFVHGKCQELSELDLNFFQCHMDLNKQACVNIKTHFQYCFWNGNNCERRVMNQDYDCPLKVENSKTRVNGNVCQAISYYQKKCKYNAQTNLCIESSITDRCNTPFINKIGCLSIVKKDEACQWTMQGCRNVEVLQQITTCNNLGSANPIACSQVFESDQKVGCYFDQQKQKCVVLNIEVGPYATKEEIIKKQKDLELLRTISCNDIALGLNKIGCSSITTIGVACRWSRDQCVQIENPKDIQTLPCLSLVYANYKACSYVLYGGEVCRYSSLVKGCVNSITKNMQCNELGLNSFGCSKAEGSCQYIDNQCVQSEGGQTNPQPTQSTGSDVDTNPPTPLTCEITSPTKTVCLSFVSLLCKWTKSKSACETVEVKQNSSCLEYGGSDISVNSDVCASIIMDFPDYDFVKGVQADKNRGYCYHNKQISQCQVKKEFCNTKCCTEIENIGINAHSCIKFSSNEPGAYCYFNNLKCQELTDEIVDTSEQDQIKLYFNELKLPCTSMSKNSCHMIDWSLDQRCYYNGIVCLNINYNYYKDNRIFIQDPSVLNENACFAIDGRITVQNTLKYIGYDDENKRCKELLLDDEFSYATCEDAKANRNVCQRYTGRNYCKWDEQLIRCITIPLDEYGEIQTCVQNLNVKACTDIKKSSCLFQKELDICEDAYKSQVVDVFNIDCTHFKLLGKVSWQVCQQINKPGQQCEFLNYDCVDSTKVSGSCDGQLANNRSCFKNTKGLCRWDPATCQCFVNHQDISQLSCQDNINIELCKKITKEACIWNDITNDCQVFITQNSTDFEIFNKTGNHKFNERACLIITGDAYYYDKVTQKCTKLVSQTVDCDTYQLNKYACLYHTRTHHCFYDEDEVVPNNKCKKFNQDQSICSSKWQINIEVCMDIQQPCVFDITTLQCTSFGESKKCSELTLLSADLKHPNKRVCSSVADTLEETVGELQCFEDKQNQQQCKFEKYCLWFNYGCEIFKIVYDVETTPDFQQQTIKECDFEEINACEDEVAKNTSGLFRKDRKSMIDSSWDWENETCIKHITTFTREHNYYYISNNTQNCTIKECSIIEEYFCNVDEITETIIPFGEASSDIPDSSIYSIGSNLDTGDTCENLDCSQLSEYSCRIAKNDCLQQNTCQLELDYPFQSLIQGSCLPKKNYIFNQWCQLKQNIVDVCLNTFSKALCLDLSDNCYYDSDQGGCKYIAGNEHKIVDCNQIANNCYVSSNFRAICQNGQSSIKPGDQCKTVQKPHKTCVPLLTYQSTFSCSNILSQDAQPILCSKASDDCRFDGQMCISTMPTLKSNGKCPCDMSFSKQLCTKCGCDYDYTGYCQETKQVPQVKPDKSNKYFLCFEVNLLNTSFIKEICGKVDEACAYRGSTCQDANHYTCSELLLYTGSLKACQKCQEYATKYDATEQKCSKIDNTVQNSCDNLNQIACLLNTKGVKCKWENFSCQTISIQKSDVIQCSILNFDACYSSQVNICWIDQATSLCVDYDPYKGKCDLLKTESLCVRSMYENCKWSSNQCIQSSVIPNDTCENLNQYLCLNAQNISCGWSDVYEKCYKLVFNSEPASCVEFLSSEQQSFINRCNSYTCTQIKVQQGCIHDSYYKCRAIIPLDVISCEVSPISNINEFACAKLAKGKCKFVERVCGGMCKFQQSLCDKTEDPNLGCQNYLNQEACLYQNGACKFDIFCQPYAINSLDEIRTIFPYTSGVCQTANIVVQQGDISIGRSLIYGAGQQRCLDITDKNIIINKCSYSGMNKYSCLLKTNTYCEYKDGLCRFVDQKVIATLKTCNEYLNQYACTRLNVACKFVDNKCASFDEKDDCSTLQQEKAIVNSVICLREPKTPCMFNDSTQNCVVITTPQNCKDLNKKGCIFATQGYNCEFKSGKCITSFGNPRCVADINEDKCLSIITKGQFCYFDSLTGCKNVDITKVDLNKCEKNSLRTNPNTCSKSTDVPCFYDKTNKYCIEFTDSNGSISSNPANYNISNIYSLNKRACQMFNYEKALMWQETCSIVKSSQLIYLKCSAFLNKIACLSIKTPFQFCQYKNFQCVNANLQDFKSMSCDQIKDVNSGAFCSVNTNSTPCQYNKTFFRCESFDKATTTTVNCVEKDPEEKGLNQPACEIDKKNCVFDENCYRLNESGFQFCKDINKVDSQFQCKQVTGEGCIIDSNSCKKIYYDTYSKIKCEQASNRFGCVNIQTTGQFCQFDGEKCKLENVKEYADISCLSVVNINHYSFCEQTKDIACTFDLKTNTCRNVYSQEVFSCERGLNKIACLNQTTPSLMCKFLDYCYGPNNGILNCIHNDNDLCCREADQIDTCLNQKIYQCEWTADGCRAYTSTTQDCNDIVNKSFLICAAIKNVLCVYAPSDHKCQTEIPTTCGFSQTNQQCKRMKSVSCIWNQEEEICTYSENSAYLTCQEVSQYSGNQRACMNVEVQGQMCIYKDEKCILFVQSETSNNCLDSINKNACLQQTIDDCQWVEQVYKVIKYQNSPIEVEIVYGECQPITDINQTFCYQNISYTACMKTNRIGEFCIWKDFRCQQISEQEVYTPNQLILVNQNACGLINNGDIVKYDEMFKKCVIIENPNELTCNPQIIGLNKEACMTITNQSCVWNIISKSCSYSEFQDIPQLCERPNSNAFSCSNLDIDHPCGYSDGGCHVVDLNSITCTHPGLNKYACLNIKNHPCIWKYNEQTANDYCDDYIPYTYCLAVPINVNPKVCSLVDQDSCQYDIKNNKCKALEPLLSNCDTIGLNLKGCIEIDGCAFKDQCIKVTEKLYNCNEFPLANYHVCSNAQDNCKFNELTYGCQQSNIELCDTKGLSQLGCIQSNCLMENNQCQCTNGFMEENCNVIQEVEKCNQLEHCIYVEETKKCKWKQCEDLQYNYCDGQQINQFYCYQTSSQQCKSAKRCEDIHNPASINPTLNNKPCIFNSDSQFYKLLNCEVLDEQQCQSYPKYCIFDEFCRFSRCSDLKQINCPSNICYWNSKMGVCQDQVECSQISDKNQCTSMKYEDRQCSWITQENQSFCTDSPCRFLVKKFGCSGLQISEQICVEVDADNCLSCEEISRPCICLQHNQYCDYNFNSQKCESRTCSNQVDQSKCPQEHCDFSQKCVPKCQYIADENLCKNTRTCTWDEKCKSKEVQVVPTQENVKIWGLINIFTLSILILYL